MHTQLAVLGGGPGGYAAAFLAADEGMDVTLVEAESRLGGTCLIRGCIPSKALLHVARVMSEVDELGRDWGIEYEGPRIDLDQVRQRKRKVVETLSRGLGQLCKRRNVRRIEARASLENSTTLHLAGNDPALAGDDRLTFDHLILATGSQPITPAPFAIQTDRVMDSAAALELADIPETLLVIGGGYIGLELGTIYAKLGSKVSVVEITGSLLPGTDGDLVKPLHRRLETLFEKRIYLNTAAGSLTDRGGSIEVVLDGPDTRGVESFDRVLVAVGRRPRTDDLGLEYTRVQLDERGFVVCDHEQRTADPHILAVGDVAGEPMLAHKALHQGKVAAEVLLGRPAEFDPAAIPAVVFTDPEIAWAGLTQVEAERQGRKIAVSLFPWAASGRAHATCRTEGLTKWIIDPRTERVLGCGIVGAGAGELIAEAVLAMEMNCELREVSQSIHPHPTMSETLMTAAEVHLGMATEIYKPKKRK